MKRFLVFAFLFLCSSVLIHAQEVNVSSIIELFNDKTAENSPRQDYEGDYCALLKIEAPGIDGLVFKGTIVGDIEHKSGVYYVYVSAGTKKINFQHSRFLPGTIDFSSAGVTITGKTTYSVILEASEAKDSSYGSLTVTSSLGGCRIFLDRMDIGEAPVFLSQVEPGKHIVSMSKNYYETVEVSVTIAGGENTDVSFSPKLIPMVDLGLSVKWATCNIGATTPEGAGNYYAWGETQTKREYSTSTYPFFKPDYSKYIVTIGGKEYNTIITKYCKDGKHGEEDGKDTLESSDDVAYVSLGKDWRMPTKDEWQELIDNCTWVWTSLNGVNGYLVTSKKPRFAGRSIFLPVTGCYQEKLINDTDSRGDYWSSSLNTKLSTTACRCVFTKDFFELVNSSRWDGGIVRPVYVGR